MTAIPATVNFKLYQYADFSEPVTLRDSEGDPINLTGATGLMHVRREREDEDPVLTFTTSNSTMVFGGALGTVTLASPGADNDMVVDPDGEVWFYDLIITFSGGAKERTFQGVILVYPGVTIPP